MAQEKHVFSLCVKRDVCFYIHLLYFTCSSCDTKKKRVKKPVKSRVSGVTGKSILLVPYLCQPVPLCRKIRIQRRNLSWKEGADHGKEEIPAGESPANHGKSDHGRASESPQKRYATRETQEINTRIRIDGCPEPGHTWDGIRRLFLFKEETA